MSWKCPACGREFKRTDQSHYCGKPRTVDEYIDSRDEYVRPRLRELRAVLLSALPDAEECLSWSMPTYRRGRNLIHFAAAKKHIGLYPGGEATTFFAEELKDFDVSRGTVRLPMEGELPVELIARIAVWCRETYGK